MKNFIYKTTALMFFVLILNSFVRVNNCIGQWTQTNGPYGGSTYCLAVKGINLFAGGSGGIFVLTILCRSYIFQA
jgi:hypothetical protein